jgi:hypothetical protein
MRASEVNPIFDRIGNAKEVKSCSESRYLPKVSNVPEKNICLSSAKGRTGDALALTGDEGRGWLR